MDSLSALQSLLSANGAAVSSTTGNATDTLSSLLETLANVAVQSNSGNGDVGNIAHETSASSNMDSSTEMASLFMAELLNTRTESSLPTADDFEHYERSREERYKELEKKFSLASQPKIPRSNVQEKPTNASTSTVNSSMADQISSSAGLAASAAKHALVSTALKGLISKFQQRASGNAKSSTNSAVRKSTSKRRSRSISSGSSISSSSRSSSDSNRHGSKRKRSDRKKKEKKSKSKEKPKNGKSSSSSAKISKTKKINVVAKKDTTVSETKTISEKIAKLKSNLDNYEKRRKAFEDELSRLKKQHNEMCRKLQRHKSDPKKDPLIIDNEALQQDIEKEMKSLAKQKDADLKALEIEEKRLGKLKKDSKTTSKHTNSNPIKRPADTTAVEVAAKKSKLETEENVEYFDPGSHWCKHCNSVSANVYEWLEHLHSHKHKANLDLMDRPWMPAESKSSSKSQGVGAFKGFKGTEFLVPSTAFYCTLCKAFSGDSLCAESHLKSSGHNKNYEAYVETNPFYERRERLEKAAAVSLRLEKNSASSSSQPASSSDQQHRKNLDIVPYGPREPEAQRKPHVPNESGKIKPFRLSTSSASNDRDKNDVKRSEKQSIPSSVASRVVIDSKKASSSGTSTSISQRINVKIVDGREKMAKYGDERVYEHRHQRPR